MTIHPTADILRMKIIGTLMRDARLATGKSPEECARCMGVTPDIYQAYELGQKAPSLPELENLAYFLDIPLEHFWENKSLSEADKPSKALDIVRLTQLRQKMIGALLRNVRQEANLTLEMLAERTGMDVSLLEAYELGQRSIPLPHLETLSRAMNCSVREFLDQHGPVGIKDMQRRALQNYMKLPPDLQAFVGKPINRPFLELAQRLSEMSVEKLRAVAEGLLEITY